jgi:hypothetical protein
MALRTPPETDIDEIENDEYTGPLKLTREQAIAFFETEVQKKLDITGEEFLRRRDAGENHEAIDLPGNIDDLEMFSHVVR